MLFLTFIGNLSVVKHIELYLLYEKVQKRFIISVNSWAHF